MMPRKQVAVIGAGISGMMAIKCLKEDGFEPTCYEKTCRVGGLWNYREDDVDGVGSVMWSTVINHSKEIGAFSDFPPKKEYPNYMRQFEVMEMFEEYAKEFDITRHILCNTEVLRVFKTEDYEITGRWVVKVKNGNTGEITEDIFDAVFVCTGHNTYPKMANFPGMEKYKGKIIHTHGLKKVDEFKDQNVVVVGAGCSGLDAAVEISNVAKQVYLSTRTGTWVFPRVGPHGLPTDFALIRRFMFCIQKRLPISFMSTYLENNVLNKKFNHALYNLKPSYHALSKDPSVNDIISSKLMTGSVVIRKNIKFFANNGVLFDGEEQITEIQSVIMATGYSWKFPFLDQNVVTTENGRINLYKLMYPPQLPHPTLAIIGYYLPYGPGFPLSEIQCRWASHLLTGRGSLPTREMMIAEVIKRHEENVKRYQPAEKMTIRVDNVPYMDDIASQFGAKPDFLRMAFRDPKLFSACMFGPFFPYQFRLEGPHSWPGARDAIFTAYDRMRRPLEGPSRSKKRFLRDGSFFKYMLALITLCIYISLIEPSMKYYLIALFAPYILSWKSFVSKYLFLVLILQFLTTWPVLSKAYFLTIVVSLGLTLVTSV